jgi:cytochrome P450 family 6
LSHDDLTAQATVFFLAGFDTSSSATSYACWELAENPDVQERVQQEIDQVLGKYEEKVTYEALKEMKFLDCVINGKFLEEDAFDF